MGVAELMYEPEPPSYSNHGGCTIAGQAHHAHSGETKGFQPFLKKIENIIKSKFSVLGSGLFIPDQTFFHPGSRIRFVSIQDPGSWNRFTEFKYFNQKMVSKL
jgi:hypothetical protein